jgi:hypothetical protein
VAVFASVFYLPPPKALNWLINERIKKPVMVLQVMGLVGLMARACHGRCLVH